MGQSVTYDFSGTGNFLRFAEKVTNGAKKMQNQFKKTDRQTDKLSSKFNKLGTSTKKLGDKMGLSLAAMGAAAIASGKAFGDFESQMIDVVNLLDDGDVPQFETKLNDLSKEAVAMGFAMEDSTKGLFNVISAMGAGSTSFDTFTESQRLAIGGSAELAETVRGMTSIMNVYADEVDNVADVSNAFFVAQVKGNLTVAELARNIGTVSGSAKAVGFEFRPLLATIGEMTKTLKSTEVSATALNSAISAMKAPAKEAARDMAKLGIPVNSTQLAAMGLVDTFGLLAKIGSTERGRNAISQMFPLEALRAIEALTPAAIASIQNTVDMMEQDLLSPALAKKQAAFNFAIGETLGSIKLLAIVIGDSLSPVFRLIGFLARTMTSAFMLLNETVRSFVITALSVGGILLFFGKLGVVLSGLGGVLSGIATALSFFFIVLVGIVGSVPLAIAAVVTAVIALGALLFTQWDRILSTYETVKGFIFGLETDGDIAVTKTIENEGSIGVDSPEAVRNTLDASVTVNAPPGVVTELSSTGSGPGLNVRQQLREGL